MMRVALRGALHFLTPPAELDHRDLGFAHLPHGLAPFLHQRRQRAEAIALVVAQEQPGERPLGARAHSNEIVPGAPLSGGGVSGGVDRFTGTQAVPLGERSSRPGLTTVAGRA